MKLRCDFGQQPYSFVGCMNDRERLVERLFDDGSTVLTHECNVHADVPKEHTVASYSRPLTRAA